MFTAHVLTFLAPSDTGDDCLVLTVHAGSIRSMSVYCACANIVGSLSDTGDDCLVLTAHAGSIRKMNVYCTCANIVGSLKHGI